MLVMGYVAFTLFNDSDAQQTAIQEQKDARDRGGRKSTLGVIDLSRYSASMAKLNTAQPQTLSNPHNLFNPVQWRRTPQGTVFKVEKGTEIGPGAVRLAKTYPLYTKVEFRGVSQTGNVLRYRFTVTREAEERKKDRIRMTTTVDGENLEDIRKIFTLVKVNGSLSDPTSLTLRMSDGSDDITVVKGEIFSRVDGYTADITYPPNNKQFRNRRSGEKLFFAEDMHNIVAISESEVVLSTASTSKRTTIRLQ